MNKNTNNADTPDWALTRRRVKDFIEERIYPVEEVLNSGTRTDRNMTIARLIDEAGLLAQPAKISRNPKTSRYFIR